MERFANPRGFVQRHVPLLHLGSSAGRRESNPDVRIEHPDGGHAFQETARGRAEDTGSSRPNGTYFGVVTVGLAFVGRFVSF